MLARKDDGKSKYPTRGIFQATFWWARPNVLRKQILHEFTKYRRTASPTPKYHRSENLKDQESQSLLGLGFARSRQLQFLSTEEHLSHLEGEKLRIGYGKLERRTSDQDIKNGRTNRVFLLLGNRQKFMRIYNNNEPAGTASFVRENHSTPRETHEEERDDAKPSRGTQPAMKMASRWEDRIER